MRGVLVSVVIFELLKNVYGEYAFVGGWTPISTEEFYRRMNIKNPAVNNFLPVDLFWNQINNMDFMMKSAADIKNNALKLIEPQKVFTDFSVKKFGLRTVTNNTADKKQTDTDYIQQEISSKNSRNAKSLNNDSKNFIEEQPVDFNKINKITSNKEVVKKPEAKVYEVNQDLETPGPEPIKLESKAGYLYTQPNNIAYHAQINFTNQLQNILNKYNINNEDKLTNYAKSRVPIIRTISNKQRNVYLPIPLQLINGQNSLNHLSVDPLMAVLLSNYGHYLPYSYGIHNNYRNLYGYLASNNIHNNKPFGSYKVFSDTDSYS